MSGVDKIAAERATHEARGYTAAVDDQWESSELAKAAACYTVPILVDTTPWLWPWENEHPEVWVFNIERRIEQLAKAGALIAAEIDRLERFAAKKRAPKEKPTQEEEPQEYILIEPGQEPSGDEALAVMLPYSAAMLNSCFGKSKLRWLPSAEILGNSDTDYAEDMSEMIAEREKERWFEGPEIHDLE